MIKKTKGFTLIELLVVIAIIGILSSVVLASLNSARNKGSNAAIKSNLANARAQAEIYYDGNGTNGYTTVCSNTTLQGIKGNVEAAIAAAGSGTLAANCNSSTSTWAAWAPLKNSEGNFCVDYKGYASTTPTAPDTILSSGACI